MKRMYYKKTSLKPMIKDSMIGLFMLYIAVIFVVALFATTFGPFKTFIIIK